MKESDCRFTGIKIVWCDKCKNRFMHEVGIVKKTKEKVKICLRCQKITIIKKK